MSFWNLNRKKPQTIPIIPVDQELIQDKVRDGEKAIMADTNRNSLESALIQSMEWIKIPAGEFLYGNEKERISLPEFSILKYPVTVRQYRMFCDATHRRMPDAPDWGWIDDHPMVNVTWHDAAAFAQWVGGSLPTEKQWEKAARGTDGREYPWGNTFDAAKCVCSVVDYRSSTAPVGSRPAGVSPYGGMDMAENVWERCADWGGGPGGSLVLRGGCWLDDGADDFRAAYGVGCDIVFLKPIDE